MAKGQIGVQMMMLKGKVEELGVYETMRRVRELGYRAVEVSQIPMTAENVAELRRASIDFGIKIATCTAAVEPMMAGMPGDTLVDDFDKIVADCKTLECTYLRVGILPVSYMGNREKTLAFVAKMEDYAQKLKEHGIKLYYHNHHVEFEKYDGKYMLDIIFEATKEIGFELDVHWIQFGGESPVNVLQKYSGRVSLVHLKDYKIVPVDFSKMDPKDPNGFMQAFTGNVQFAELGEGSLDFKAIIEAGAASGSEYFLVEQDNTYGKDPFDCLRTSADYLRKIGYADWF